MSWILPPSSRYFLDSAFFLSRSLFSGRRPSHLTYVMRTFTVVRSFPSVYYRAFPVMAVHFSDYVDNFPFLKSQEVHRFFPFFAEGGSPFVKGKNERAFRIV